MSAWNSLALRIGALYALFAALALALAGAGILWLFAYFTDRALDSNLMAYADIIIGQVEMKDGAARLKDDGRILDTLPRHWQISEGGKVLYTSKNLAAPLPLLRENPRAPQRIETKDIVALQTTFLFPGGRKITLASGLDRAAADAFRVEEQKEMAGPLLRILVLAGIGLALAGAGLSFFALRPLRRIGTALQAVREGRSARIEGKYPAELETLASDINRLLDYTAASLARHREFSGNLAHALKTPLTVIANETDAAVIKKKLAALMDIVDRSLARLRAAGTADILSAATPLRPVLADIAESFGKVYAKQVEAECPDDAIFRGDRADLFEIMGNIIENACKFSKSRVSIRFDGAAIAVEDDGPGIPPDLRDHAQKRGARLDETTPGTGIGLGVAGDIAALYQGRIELDDSPLGGLKVLVFLPIAR